MLAQRKNWGRRRATGGSYHEEESECVVESGDALVAQICFFDLKTAWGEDDGEGEPEAAVRGESGSAEGVANGHFPFKRPRQHHVALG